MMIPKKIHYCWFGGNPKSQKELDCIASWKKYCPDYEFIEWNEKNFDVNMCQYASDAYKEKKWSFVSDYARIFVIYHYGGIYLDTDVELVKNLDNLLNEKMYCGFEARDPFMDTHGIEYEESVNFGLGYGAEAGHPILKELLDLYETMSFYREDGSLNLLACPHYQTEVLKRFGLVPNRQFQRLENCVVFPEDYFSPKSYYSGRIVQTPNTISIHHFTASWTSSESKRRLELKWKYMQKYGPVLTSFLLKIDTLRIRIKAKIGKN